MANKTEPGRCRRVWGSESNPWDGSEPAGVGSSKRVGGGGGRTLLRALPRDVSVGKVWRFRRNIVIFVAYREGIPQRVLADVFDLPRSRIATIIKEIKNIYISG